MLSVGPWCRLPLTIRYIRDVLCGGVHEYFFSVYFCLQYIRYIHKLLYRASILMYVCYGLLRDQFHALDG